jgi:HemY protein
LLRALWFFLQLLVVSCAIIWIVTQRGAVAIQWNDYTLSLDLGIFLLFLGLFTLVAVASFRLINAIVNIPSGMSRRRRERNRRKGFQALTRGFAAIAAGDEKKATACAREVRHLLPDENGLPILLEAQAARLRGAEGEARQSFEKLLSDKDAAFFGIRGLMKSSLDEGDYGRALMHARDALSQNPKQPWILKSVYDLEILAHQWDEAYRTLEKLRRYRAIDLQKAAKDEIALLMIQAERAKEAGDTDLWLKKTERAWKLDPSFAPVAAALGEYWIGRGKPFKAASFIEKAWRLNPHPDLAALWEKAMPEGKAGDPLRVMRWMEKLSSMRPDSADGRLAVAKAAMDCGLNGEAKSHLLAAESVRPTARLYRLRADMEEATSRNPVLVREWLEKAASAPSDPVWYCRLTGHIYDRWSPVAQPHGAFNTIEWGNPSPLSRAGEPLLKEWKDPLLIEQN